MTAIRLLCMYFSANLLLSILPSLSLCHSLALPGYLADGKLGICFCSTASQAKPLGLGLSSREKKISEEGDECPDASGKSSKSYRLWRVCKTIFSTRLMVVAFHLVIYFFLLTSLVSLAGLSGRLFHTACEQTLQFNCIPFRLISHMLVSPRLDWT
ncbi:unnamed protein product [Protopolystoma xenopodis]|uniref:Uncharacterized protein n=1 Tax=Protopolystoma xenopodis TaxID=117903 RepID=A0A3S5AYU1_9PLAT|nr:unnamed protein product [Protopolystoma xenopodis]